MSLTSNIDIGILQRRCTSYKIIYGSYKTRLTDEAQEIEKTQKEEEEKTTDTLACRGKCDEEVTAKTIRMCTHLAQHP